MANEDKRIIELPASTSILNDDWIAKDSASQDTTRLQLSLLKQLFGGNNFAGEWQSGTTFARDSYVVHEGKLYHNISGGGITQLSWSASPWQEITVSEEIKKLATNLANTFNKNTSYGFGDYVVYNNVLFKCVAAHSGVWNPVHFTEVNATSLVNDVVTQLNNAKEQIYTNIYANIAPTFSSSAQYNINDFVIYGNQLYICVKPHHGSWYSPDFSIAKIGEVLEGIFHDIADVYSPSGSYVKGDVVNYLGVPLRCIVDTATSPMVFSEWEQVTVAQLIDEKVADVQIAGQTTVDENKISDLTSLAIEGTASGEIASFSDGSNLPMRSFICNISAQQDLHGYDTPWVGGAGKNKLPLTLDNIKALNTAGTWSGNTYTHPLGVTFTFTTNNDGSITSIKADGTSPSSNVTLYLKQGITNSTYPNEMTVSGSPSGGGSSTYKIRCQLQGPPNTTIADDFGNGANFTIPNDGNSYQVIIRIQSGVTVSNLMFYPMVRLATVTDATFAPYSNICPISGHTGVDAWVRGKNQLPMTVDGIKAANTSGTWSGNSYTRNGVTYTILTDSDNNIIGISLSGTATADTALDFPSLTLANDGFLSGCPVGGSVSTYRLRFSGFSDTGSGVAVDAVTQAKVPYIWIANGVNTNGLIFYPMIRLATETDATFAPYNPNSQTIQVSWQTEAGEVFDGYVDLVSGELTATHKEITYDGVTSGKMFSSRITGSNNAYYNSLPDGFDFNTTGRVSSTDMKKYGMINSHYDYTDDSSVGFYAGIGTTTGYLQPRILFGADSDITTVELANQWLATQYANGTPWQVVYPLATPITYQLTPQQIKSLLGENNAWCSTGDVNVKYNKDATIVINSLIARIEALENA